MCTVAHASGSWECRDRGMWPLSWSPLPHMTRVPAFTSNSPYSVLRTYLHISLDTRSHEINYLHTQRPNLLSRKSFGLTSESGASNRMFDEPKHQQRCFCLFRFICPCTRHLVDSWQPRVAAGFCRTERFQASRQGCCGCKTPLERFKFGCPPANGSQRRLGLLVPRPVACHTS